MTREQWSELHLVKMLVGSNIWMLQGQSPFGEGESRGEELVLSGRCS